MNPRQSDVRFVSDKEQEGQRGWANKVNEIGKA